jgi:sarcosine oxidase delta subunit
MLLIRCPFCHKRVLRYFDEGHKAKHLAPLPDGQQKDHVTLHPSGR